jgi:hypothetical protein
LIIAVRREAAAWWWYLEESKRGRWESWTGWDQWNTNVTRSLLQSLTYVLTSFVKFRLYLCSSTWTSSLLTVTLLTHMARLITNCVCSKKQSTVCSDKETSVRLICSELSWQISYHEWLSGPPIDLIRVLMSYLSHGERWKMQLPRDRMHIRSQQTTRVIW